MALHATERRYQTNLLSVLIGIIFLVQAGSAVLVHIDTTVSPSQSYLGDPVTVYVHVYTIDYPVVMMTNVPVRVWVAKPFALRDDITGTTNATGWAAITYTPDAISDYGVTGFATIDFSAIRGLPAVGIQNYPLSPVLAVVLNDLNVTIGPHFLSKTLVPLSADRLNRTHTPTPTATPTATTPVPTTTATPTPPILPEVQITPATTATTAAPALPSVTTLPAGGTAGSAGPAPEPAAVSPAGTGAMNTLTATGTSPQPAASPLQPVSALAAALIVPAFSLYRMAHTGKK